MVRAVAPLEIRDAVFGVDGLAVRRGGQVAIPEGVADRAAFVVEVGQFFGQPPQFGFVNGVGVVCDEVHEPLGGIDLHEIGSAVDGMKASVDQIGGIPDVVKDGRGFEQFGVRSGDWREGARLPSNPLDVGPSSRQRVMQLRLGEVVCSRNQRHPPTVTSRFSGRTRPAHEGALGADGHDRAEISENSGRVAGRAQ